MNEKIDLEQIEGSEGFGFPLSNLDTANKFSLVGAINEVNNNSVRTDPRHYRRVLATVSQGTGVWRLSLGTNHLVGSLRIRLTASYFNGNANGLIELKGGFFGNSSAIHNNGLICSQSSSNGIRSYFYIDPIIKRDASNGVYYLEIHKKATPLNPIWVEVNFISADNNIGSFNPIIESFNASATVSTLTNEVSIFGALELEGKTITRNNLNRLRLEDTYTILSSNVGSAIYLRPNGDASVSGEARLDSSGVIFTSSNGNSSQWKQAFDWGSHKAYSNSVETRQYLGGNYISTGSEKPSFFGSGKLELRMLNGSNLGNGLSGWFDTLWLSAYTGGDVKRSTIIVSSKQNATGIGFIKQDYDATDWGTYYDFWHSGNFNPASYVLQTSLNSQLGNYATKAGTQSFTGQNTFTVTPIVPNGTLDGHTVNLGQLNTLLVAKADVRLSNLVSDLSTTEKATIKNKLGVIDTTYTNGTGLDLTNNVFSITIAIQNSISKGFTAYGWGNHASAGYALTSQLVNYVPVNGAFTINGTKTFSSSPVVPNATLSSHAVNLGQVYNIVNNVIISNDIVELDLLITDEFQSILDNIPQIGIEYAKCYYRNKTLGVAITIKNSSSSPVDVFGSSTSIVSLFTLPDEIMYRINQSIRDLIPQFKLQNSDPVSSYSSYQTFVELDGVIKHPFGLLLSENYSTVMYGEFECLDIL